MAFFGIKIPEDIATKLKRIEVPGKREDELHVTMFYFPDKLEIDDISNVIEATFQLVESQEPFEIEIAEVNCFPKNEDGVPIKLEVKSPYLLKVQAEQAKLFDKFKINYSKKYPKYQPHITLSYGEEEIKPIKFKKPVSILVTELQLWAGDWGPTKLVCTFPLEFNLNKKSQLKYQNLKLSYLSKIFKYSI